MSEPSDPDGEADHSTGEVPSDRILKEFAVDILIPKFWERDSGPGIDGYDLIERLEELLPEILIPFVSALADSSDPENRMVAADLLPQAWRSDLIAAEAIRERLRTDPVRRIRLHAARPLDVTQLDEGEPT
jgi:hypothetical protein